MIVCFLLAEKLYSDDEYTIESFSLASGIPIKDLARLEEQVISLLEYELIITEREFNEIRRFDAGNWIITPTQPLLFTCLYILISYYSQNFNLFITSSCKKLNISTIFFQTSSLACYNLGNGLWFFDLSIRKWLEHYSTGWLTSKANHQKKSKVLFKFEARW